MWVGGCYVTMLSRRASVFIYLTLDRPVGMQHLRTGTGPADHFPSGESLPRNWTDGRGKAGFLQPSQNTHCLRSFAVFCSVSWLLKNQNTCVLLHELLCVSRKDIIWIQNNIFVLRPDPASCMVLRGKIASSADWPQFSWEKSPTIRIVISDSATGECWVLPVMGVVLSTINQTSFFALHHSVAIY